MDEDKFQEILDGWSSRIHQLRENGVEERELTGHVVTMFEKLYGWMNREGLSTAERRELIDALRQRLSELEVPPDWQSRVPNMLTPEPVEEANPLLELALLAICLGGPWAALFLLGGVGGIVTAVVSFVLWMKYGPAAVPGLLPGLSLILVLGNAICVIVIALKTLPGVS